MSTQSEQASVEVRIDWEDSASRHHNRDHFEKLNFWRDILPGALSVKLPGSSGEWLSESFAAGELVPPWSENNIHCIKQHALNLQRKHGPAIKLQPGRHYPQYIAAGTAEIFAGNSKPLRVSAIDNETVTVDLNHPLARSPLTISARIIEHLGPASEHGGRCNDIVMDTMASGVGLETLYPCAEARYLSTAVLERMDTRTDGQFYENARLVQHIDRTAIGRVSELYRRELRPGMQVLDFMSSWDSHLPEGCEPLSVTGLGMNAAELAQNPRLDSRVVHDVNAVPALPFDDNQFDAIICTVSVEYLVKPVDVFRELGRILKPGAAAIITFSDRWFPTKVVTLWTELHPFERLALVQEYFRSAGNFSSLETETVHGLPRPQDDKYVQQRAFSDPVFAARAIAAS